MRTAPPPSPEEGHSRPRGRVLWMAAALGLAPKCVLCVATYFAGGAAFVGTNASELCGGPAGVGAGVAITVGSAVALTGLLALRTLRARRHRVAPRAPKLAQLLPFRHGRGG